MSRKLAPLFLAMLVLAGAMGLKTIVATHGDTTVMMASGSPVPRLNGPAPVPRPPFKSTSTSPW